MASLHPPNSYSIDSASKTKTRVLNNAENANSLSISASQPPTDMNRKETYAERLLRHYKSLDQQQLEELTKSQQHFYTQPQNRTSQHDNQAPTSRRAENFDDAETLSAMSFDDCNEIPQPSKRLTIAQLEAVLKGQVQDALRFLGIRAAKIAAFPAIKTAEVDQRLQELQQHVGAPKRPTSFPSLLDQGIWTTDLRPEHESIDSILAARRVGKGFFGSHGYAPSLRYNQVEHPIAATGSASFLGASFKGYNDEGKGKAKTKIQKVKIRVQERKNVHQEAKLRVQKCNTKVRETNVIGAAADDIRNVETETVAKGSKIDIKVNASPARILNWRDQVKNGRVTKRDYS